MFNYLPENSNKYLLDNSPKKYHLGCGTIFLRNWLNIGHWTSIEQGSIIHNPNGVMDTVLLNHDLRLGIPAANNSLESVYHAHMLEHLSYKDGISFLTKIYNSLEQGGIHRVIVPDLEAFIRSYCSSDSFLLNKYREHVLQEEKEIYVTKGSIFMGMLHNHEHKMGYDYETLKWILEYVGFRNITRTLYQESNLIDIKEIEQYSPLRTAESLCVECIK